jgi:serine/threonine-protein kinase
MADDALLSPGLIIAETYEVERLLGRGGMGEVWLASHRRLAGKQVAVKVLRVSGEVSPDALARFKREAEIAARLEHPNIVQVLDYNSLPSGQPFLVMELLKGHSLAQRLRSGPLPLEEARQVVRQVGAALQVAHAGGVVHRDLKPENIFLVPTALGTQVKVLDFGISKVAGSDTVQTTDAVLIGTPLYMSPEQALGQNRDFSPRSDLFSLGSICFELLTGRAPFEADSVAQVVFRIAYEPAPSLAAARPDLPPEVVAAVEHALVKDRAGRTPDVDTFVAEFTGAPLSTPEATPAAGVYSPGMAVSESLVSGKTAHPGERPVVATPSRRTTGQEASGSRIAVGLVVAAVALAAGVVATRQYWQRTPGPPMAAADEVPDAGPPVPVKPPDTPKPPLPEVARPVEVARPSMEPAAADVVGPEDQQVLERLRALAAQGDHEALEGQRNRARLLRSRRARVQALAWVVEAMCRRGNNVALGPAISDLKESAGPAAVRAARERCIQVYPAAADLAW